MGVIDVEEDGIIAGDEDIAGVDAICDGIIVDDDGIALPLGAVTPTLDDGEEVRPHPATAVPAMARVIRVFFMFILYHGRGSTRNRTGVTRVAI